MICRTAFDLDSLRAQSQKLTSETAAPDFWDKPGHEDTLKELSQVNSRLEALRHMNAEYDDLSVITEMLHEADDQELEAEFAKRAEALRRELEHMSLLLLLNEPYDASNAIMMIHSGSGGLDSQDWAGMLLRMYLRYCERTGFSTNLIETTTDDDNGIKSAALLVQGQPAYGLLKAERGVHRLVRISPFDCKHRRHTSFASVLVSPEFPDDVDIDLRPEDLKIDTFRASGAGGQYVNRTDSAVRITHIPSGIVVTCQNERSQHSNRQTAMHVLKSRLYEMALSQRHEELSSVVGEKKETAWGNQIRSYILHPYTMVKDHRTSCERGNVQAVLDGDIDCFIKAYLVHKARGDV